MSERENYNSSAYPEVAKLLRAEKVDFVQINYSLGEREAEREILPLAQERGGKLRQRMVDLIAQL